jgi:hypothetical protein
VGKRAYSKEKDMSHEHRKGRVQGFESQGGDGNGLNLIGRRDTPKSRRVDIWVGEVFILTFGFKDAYERHERSMDTGRYLSLTMK